MIFSPEIVAEINEDFQWAYKIISYILVIYLFIKYFLLIRSVKDSVVWMSYILVIYLFIYLEKLVSYILYISLRKILSLLRIRIESTYFTKIENFLLKILGSFYGTHVNFDRRSYLF